MKKIRFCLFALAFSTLSHAQSLRPQVIATAGGYQSSGYSLSYTIGETVTPTLSAGGYMLTQGFQQPFKVTLNLKCFLQGYYSGGSSQVPVLFNEGVSASTTLCDTILIELRSSVAPFAVVSQHQELLGTNGLVTFTGTAPAGSYYIVVKHRNTVQTWSAMPVILGVNTFYDFSLDAAQAYGGNQALVEPGVYAMFSGDINQDENIDLLDLALQEADINGFAFGYFNTDINGDGNVDLLDNPVLEANVNAFVFSMHP